MIDEKLKVNLNKSLKLTNVIMKTLDKKELEEFVNEVIKLENYIKSKGAKPIGPLIQYTNGYVNENGVIDIKVNILRQTTNYIHNVESPYRTESLINVKNCLYVRYNGDENKIKYAYDKLNLLAFEEDIILKGDSYTVFVAQNDDNLIADVFMEKE